MKNKNQKKKSKINEVEKKTLPLSLSRLSAQLLSNLKLQSDPVQSAEHVHLYSMLSSNSLLFSVSSASPATTILVVV